MDDKKRCKDTPTGVAATRSRQVHDHCLSGSMGSSKGPYDQGTLYLLYRELGGKAAWAYQADISEPYREAVLARLGQRRRRTTREMDSQRDIGR